MVDDYQSTAMQMVITKKQLTAGTRRFVRLHKENEPLLEFSSMMRIWANPL
jgi:hypothetical protein